MRLTTTRTSARTAQRLGAATAAGLLAVLLAGCGSETGSDDDAAAPDTSSETSDPAPSDTATSDAPASSDLPEWAPAIVTEGDDVTGLDFTDTPEPTDELKFALVTTGTGPAVVKGQTITADYFGELYDGDAPFDESYSGEPFTAPIGVGSLIQGWDQALVGVPVGSRVIMSIPPELGYGEAGSGPIPGNSYLFFVIDVIDATD